MLLSSPNAGDVAESAQDRLQGRFLNDVWCECRDGVLHLRGFCRTFYEKQMAQESVRHVDGVVTVVNEIEVDQ